MTTGGNNNNKDIYQVSTVPTCSVFGCDDIATEAGGMCIAHLVEFNNKREQESAGQSVSRKVFNKRKRKGDFKERLKQAKKL
jgi:hypothetical protein